MTTVFTPSSFDKLFWRLFKENIILHPDSRFGGSEAPPRQCIFLQKEIELTISYKFYFNELYKAAQNQPKCAIPEKSNGDIVID